MPIGFTRRTRVLSGARRRVWRLGGRRKTFLGSKSYDAWVVNETDDRILELAGYPTGFSTAFEDVIAPDNEEPSGLEISGLWWSASASKYYWVANNGYAGWLSSDGATMLARSHRSQTIVASPNGVYNEGGLVGIKVGASDQTGHGFITGMNAYITSSATGGPAGVADAEHVVTKVNANVVTIPIAWSGSAGGGGTIRGNHSVTGSMNLEGIVGDDDDFPLYLYAIREHATASKLLEINRADNGSGIDNLELQAKRSIDLSALYNVPGGNQGPEGIAYVPGMQGVRSTELGFWIAIQSDPNSTPTVGRSTIYAIAILKDSHSDTSYRLIEGPIVLRDYDGGIGALTYNKTTREMLASYDDTGQNISVNAVTIGALLVTIDCGEAHNLSPGDLFYCDFPGILGLETPLRVAVNTAPDSDTITIDIATLLTVPTGTYTGGGSISKVDQPCKDTICAFTLDRTGLPSGATFRKEWKTRPTFFGSPYITAEGITENGADLVLGMDNPKSVSGVRNTNAITKIPNWRLGNVAITEGSGPHAPGTVLHLVASNIPTGYRPVWSGTDNDASHATTNTLTVGSSNAYASMTVEVDPGSPPTWTLTLTAGANGTLDASGTSPYDDGDVVTLTATPDTGYQVASWLNTDDDSSTDNTNTVTMTADTEVFVDFELIPEAPIIDTNPYPGPMLVQVTDAAQSAVYDCAAAPNTTGSTLPTAVKGEADWCAVVPVVLDSLPSSGTRYAWSLYHTTGPKTPVRLTLTAAGVLKAEIFDSSDVSLAASSLTLDSTYLDQLIWICVSNDNTTTTSQLQLSVIKADGTVVSGSTPAAYTAASFAASAHNRLRMWAASSDALLAYYGALVFRSHKLGSTELTALASNRTDPLAHRTLSGSGLWNGDTGLIISVGHGGVADPDDADVASTQGAISQPFDPYNVVAADNLLTNDKGRGVQTGATAASNFAVRSLSWTITGSPLFVGSDVVIPGFWTLGTPSDGSYTVTVESVAALSPVFRELADSSTTGRRRVLWRSNSRGMTTTEMLSRAGYVDQANYGGGARARRRSVCNGALAVRPTTSQDSLFGLDLTGESSGRYKTGFANGLTGSGKAPNFGRWFSGGATVSLTGGNFVLGTVHATPGSYYIYQTLNNAEPGSLFTFDRTRTHRMVFLKYPGACQPTVVMRGSNTSRRDTAASTPTGNTATNFYLRAATLETLDTQVNSATVVSVAGNIVTLEDIGLGVEVGHAIFVQNATSHAISVVTAVEESGGNTVVTLERAFDLAYCVANQLNGALSDSATTVTVDSASSFPATGTVLIDSEQITYTGTTGTTLTGCTRGANGTTAAAHSDNAAVTLAVAAGWTGRWGPWGYANADGVGSAADGYTYAGLAVYTPDSTGNTGPVVLGAEEWFSTANGFTLGSDGWSGNGAANQLAAAWTTPGADNGISAFYALLAHFDLDVFCIAGTNNQGDDSAYLTTWTAGYRAAVAADAEVVWTIEGARPDSTTSLAEETSSSSAANWADGAEDDAAAAGVCALIAYLTMGKASDVFVRGYMNDTAHYSLEGASACAEAWFGLAAAGAAIGEQSAQSGEVVRRLLRARIGPFHRLRKRG